MKKVALIIILMLLSFPGCGVKHSVNPDDNSNNPPVDLIPPEAPSGLTAEVISSNSIQLAWADNSNDEHYFVIYRREGDADSFVVCQRLFYNTTSCIDIDLLDSTSYSYYVLAEKGNAKSTPSNVATAQTLVRGMSLVGEYPLLAFNSSMVFDGNYAYIATSDARVYGINIASPATPQLASTYTAPGEIKSILFHDNLYLALGNRGVQAVNYDDPAHPALLGECDTPGNASAFSWLGFPPDRYYLYVVDGDSLQIIDILYPSEMHIDGHFWMASAPTILDIATDPGYAYLACGDSGLQIIDIASNMWPTPMGRVDIPGGARKVHLSSSTTYTNYAYVLNTTSDLYIINIADRNNPILAGTFAIGEHTRCIQIQDNLAYIGYYDGLKIIDITVAPSLTYASFYFDREGIDAIEVLNGNIYFVDHAGLHILRYTR